MKGFHVDVDRMSLDAMLWTVNIEVFVVATWTYQRKAAGARLTQQAYKVETVQEITSETLRPTGNCVVLVEDVVTKRQAKAAELLAKADELLVSASSSSALGQAPHPDARVNVAERV